MEITVELDNPIKYTGENGEVEASFITIKAPTGKQTHICCELESLIQSSLVRMSEDVDQETIEAAKEAMAKEGDTPVVMGWQEAMTLMTSSGADMIKITLHLKEMFKQLAYLGGEKLITSPRLDDLSNRDLKKMMGAFVGNFILT